MSEINRVNSIFDRNRSDTELVKSQNDLNENENINLRSRTITQILVNYQNQQASRYEYKEAAKKVIVPLFCAIAGLFVVLMIVAIALSIKYLHGSSVEFLTVIISSLVTGFSAVISVILIIIKYIFPNDEEKYFNDLISIIVENDTERLVHMTPEPHTSSSKSGNRYKNSKDK